MKLFKNISPAAILMWVFPVLLLIPNVALSITEQYTIVARVANVVLPWGVYLLLTSSWARVGRTVLWCLPLSIYAAFQIVLLYLYGESIIAIDMFLNVVTTNVGEATELLANLTPAILLVIVFYLPPIVWSIIQLLRKQYASAIARDRARNAAYALVAAGVCLVVASYFTSPGYSIGRQLFPVNVICNTVQAGVRTMHTKNYVETSRGYVFDACSERPDSLREVYVLVIGETCRADNWQLAGYVRPTNPRLSRREGLIVFPRVLSESNTTHKSVPLMLSPLTSETFGDSIYYVKSIFEAFKEAGYTTAFFSNQQRNGSFIDFFGEQADSCVFIADEHKATRSDDALAGMMSGFIDGSHTNKLFVVLHSYGSHFDYADRYTPEHRLFTPDDNDAATPANRQSLINAYDNSMVMTDAFVDDVIAALDSLPADVHSAMLFIPDHGEDIFDDTRKRFLHASPTPTYWQLHVPMVIWTSKAYAQAFPEPVAAARANAHKNISSSRSVFDTLLSIAAITSNHSRSHRAITDSTFAEEPRVYLNDYNEGVPLTASGLHAQDYEMMRAHSISQ
ncbi:MAG: lipid A phosphoethanolamine transferase [Muribaculaceae bacterium]|nr:lipid A phosphoethanolamine transferase [Muribaculaceae bacterium]